MKRMHLKILHIYRISSAIKVLHCMFICMLLRDFFIIIYNIYLQLNRNSEHVIVNIYILRILLNEC